MGEVGVHLHDEAGALAEHAPEPGHVGGAEAALAGAMQDRDAVVALGHPVGDLAGPVRRGVVDDEDPADLGGGGEDRGEDQLQVLRLVVGRQDDPNGPGFGELGAHRDRAAYGAQ